MRAPDPPPHPSGRMDVHFCHHTAGPKMGISTHWISGGDSFRMSHVVGQLQRMTAAAADSDCRQGAECWLHRDFLYQDIWRAPSCPYYIILESAVAKLLI